MAQYMRPVFALFTLATPTRVAPGNSRFFRCPDELIHWVEGLGKAVVAVGNVLRGPAGARGADAIIEPTEDIVIQLVLVGHRPGLIVRNPRERRIQGDALHPVLQPEIGNHIRGTGRGSLAADSEGKTNHKPQQKSLPRQSDCLPTTHELLPLPRPIAPGRFIEKDAISH